jgi:hypothetical protein
MREFVADTLTEGLIGFGPRLILDAHLIAGLRGRARTIAVSEQFAAVSICSRFAASSSSITSPRARCIAPAQTKHADDGSFVSMAERRTTSDDAAACNSAPTCARDSRRNAIIGTVAPAVVANPKTAFAEPLDSQHRVVDSGAHAVSVPANMRSSPTRATGSLYSGVSRQG